MLSTAAAAAADVCNKLLLLLSAVTFNINTAGVRCNLLLLMFAINYVPLVLSVVTFNINTAGVCCKLLLPLLFFRCQLLMVLMFAVNCCRC